MPDIRVRVPGLLSRFTGGDRDVRIEASTVAEAVDTLLEQYPDLEPHLFTSSGTLCQHVLLFIDGQRLEWPPDPPRTIDPGEELVFLQSVTGG